MQLYRDVHYRHPRCRGTIFVSELVVLTGTMLTLYRQTDFEPLSLFKRLVAPIAAGLAMVTCWLALPEWNWMVLVIISTLVYFAILLLAKGIPLEDWQVWKSLLLRKKEQVVGGLG